MPILLPTRSERHPALSAVVPFLPSTPLGPTSNSTGEVKFPDGFIWGSATAAFQIEGAASQDGRKDSIWDAFCRVPGAVAHGHDGADACDHYHRFADDVALMQSLNLGAYRFSTSWARVRPDGGAVNPQGVAFYDRLVDSLLAADILPWLTLYHWDLPQALEERGGWANRDTAALFAEYALTMFDTLGDRVQVWTTLNEPWCSSFLSYIRGEHAPGRTDRAAGIAAGHHLLLAHGLAAEAIKAADDDAVVGLTLNFTVADPANPDDERDVAAAAKTDGLFNRFFLEPIMCGAYADDVVGWCSPVLDEVVQPGDLESISTPIDALGVNFYNGSMVAGTPESAAAASVAGLVRHATTPSVLPDDPVWMKRRANVLAEPSPDASGVYWVVRDLPRTAMGWEVHPEALARLLIRLHDDYTRPRGIALYVTENGAAYCDEADANGFVDDSATRLAFYDGHLRAVRDALDAGADVRGYFAWSLMDNFEWAWGYDKRFGIVRVDFKTQKRTVKASGRWYGEVARTNTVPPLPAGVAPLT